MTKTKPQIGDVLLRTKSKQVPQNIIMSKDIQAIIKTLTDTMRKEDLVGMAAPQIGAGIRVFVTEIRKTKFRQENLDKLRVFINPKVTWESKRQVKMYEGCGSVCDKDLFGEVSRPEEVEITYLNGNGEQSSCRFAGLLARAIQHELDHLDGKLFIDKVGDTKTLLSRDNYLRKMGIKS